MTRVLVPVAILDGETVSAGLMSLLGTMDVTVLGYHVLPEQTPPDQARAQFEDRATAALTNLTQEFQAAGGDADHRLVFTQNRRKSINRIASETDSKAFALSGATGDVENILVSLTGDVATDRIVDFVTELIGDRDIAVTLFATGESSEDGRLETATAKLTDQGITVQSQRGESGTAFDSLIDAAAGHDAIVMGEKAPSLGSLFFGEETARVAKASVGPVLVVRDPNLATKSE